MMTRTSNYKMILIGSYWSLAFLFFFSTYLLTAKGYVDTSDTTPSLLTAYSLADKGSLQIKGNRKFYLIQDGKYFPRDGSPYPEKGDVYPARGYSMNWKGEIYSWYDLGQPVAMIPFLYAGRFIGRLLGADAKQQASIEKLVICLMNTVITSITCLVVMLFGRRLGFSRLVSFALALFFGLGTMAWYYATSTYREALLTLEVLLAVYFAFDFSERKGAWRVLLSAAFVGFAVITKPVMVVIVPFVSLYLLYHCARDKEWIAFAVYCLTGLTLAAVLLYLNYYRFGSVLETGYGHENSLGQGNFLDQLRWLVFSREKGLFVHNPLLVLSLFAISGLLKKQKSLFYLFLFLIVGFVLFHFTFRPRLNYAWGPRYFVVICPLMVLPLGYWLSGRHKYLRWPVFIMFTLALVINLVSVLASPREYMSIRRRYLNIVLADVPQAQKPDTPAQVEAIFYLLRRKLRDEVPVYRMSDFGVEPEGTVDLRSFSYFYGLDVWFTHQQELGIKNPHRIAIAGSLVLLLSLAASITSAQKLDALEMPAAS